MKKFYIARAYNATGGCVSTGPSKADNTEPASQAKASEWAQNQVGKNGIVRAVIFEAIGEFKYQESPIIFTEATGDMPNEVERRVAA